MIKLFATDIDGTLVNDAKELPPDFDGLIQSIYECGAVFAVSSGRSYAALIDQFERYSDRFYFICDNGANVIYKNKPVSRSLMPTEYVDAVLKTCYEDRLIPLLCGENGTYYSSSDAEYSAEVRKYYNNTVYSPDLSVSAKSDGIFKIAVYCEKGIEKNGLSMLESRFGADLSVCLSGYYWVDIMNGGVSKGAAVRKIRSLIGAEYEETAAFGDYLNDVEMLESAYYSFAMANAHPLAKKAAAKVIGSNNDFSAAAEMRKLLGKP